MWEGVSILLDAPSLDAFPRNTYSMDTLVTKVTHIDSEAGPRNLFCDYSVCKITMKHFGCVPKGREKEREVGSVGERVSLSKMPTD